MPDRLNQIASALQRIQEAGGSNNFVIFTADIRKNYYIQFSADRGKTTLYAEAVSNRYLPWEFSLKMPQIEAMLDLGWQPPGSEPSASPNFYRTWEATTEGERLDIAHLVLQTFTDVYGLSPDHPLVIDLALG